MQREEMELLWSVQELRAVRGSGLMGAMVGALPRAPRQNGRLGRPLVLMREESRERANADRETNREANASTEANARSDANDSTEANSTREANANRDASANGEDNANREACAKREANAKREDNAKEANAEEANAKERQEQQWEEFVGRSLEQQQRLALEDRKCALMSSLSGAALDASLAALDSFVFPRSALSVQISTCRQGLPVQPIRGQQKPLEAMGVIPCGEGRVQVFSDLRRRGFCLTSGGKFGADFLVYPGDPLRFHAHFMAVCVQQGEPLSLRDVLSWIRLSSNVKKTLLLCSQCPEGGILYSSLQWSSMS